ncbi:hypothetical protein DMB65_04465 [Flavobacterium cheongpyeongense]|uniref:Lipoprotein n=1 Tax=Flavobacterium cheongpyeongense TaxID=2212651 RepID=A0A2V4C798_9FLAO|nr:hypothetical protein [Flavobacterium cheongpyeongense]PXY42074.1 hypothetical protein DMB65_04465 [Flavobacterium cheongpyeongense]
MNKKYSLLVIASFVVLFQSCNDSNKSQTSAEKEEVSVKEENQSEKLTPKPQTGKPIADFIPADYKFFQEIKGDLNKDGLEDCVVIIKGTKKENIITDEYRGKLDRNRRGIIVLFKKNTNYIEAVKNYNCFSSENEDGGVYFAPELDVSIEKGKLYVHYGHGRYGYWSYTFRYQKADFELIGYDSSDNFGPVVNSETSINFLTKKKVTKTNVNEEAESGDEVFEETKEEIKMNKIIKLSEIKDFDKLEVE